MWPSTTQPWDEVLELATFADDGFWHSLYAADHFMSPGDKPGQTSDWLEATAVMGALATVTSNIRLANLVLSMTFRHPAVVANLAVTVDRISKGRFTLGLGAGWQDTEHKQ